MLQDTGFTIEFNGFLNDCVLEDEFTNNDTSQYNYDKMVSNPIITHILIKKTGLTGLTSKYYTALRPIPTLTADSNDDAFIYALIDSVNADDAEDVGSTEITVKQAIMTPSTT